MVSTPTNPSTSPPSSTLQQVGTPPATIHSTSISPHSTTRTETSLSDTSLNSSPSLPPSHSSPDSVTFMISRSNPALASLPQSGVPKSSPPDPPLSMLSPTAPQFHARSRDMPINIHDIPLDPNLSHQRTPETILTLPTISTTVQSFARPILHSGLEFSANGAIPTPAPSQGSHTYALPPSVVISPSPSPSLVLSPSTSAASTSPDDDTKTPNVYINGLPPNCSEETLHEVASRYGEVVSVRTFTRHVSDKPSGYGFVLFHTVDAAERCIEALKKERHLHPSFSKRVHKIPGTQYATVSPNSTLQNALSAATASESEPDNFKASMERLKDPNSTNLYMEGLPLTITEDILSALVSPFRIMSSRLFQTKLSNPPRMIAFVRLETRAAAEEVVERLHGRMVRGWNDAGCRISVRFADTSEQRELRRNERSNREGDHSPNRLTVAHASLLNMSGSQGRQLVPPLQSPQLTASPNFGVITPFVDGISRRSFLPSPPPVIGLQHLPQRVTNYRGSTLNALPTPFDDVPPRVATHYDALGCDQYRRPAPNLRIPQRTFALDDEPTLLHQGRVGFGAGSGAAAARAHNGYTLREQRMILDAQLRLQGNTRPGVAMTSAQCSPVTRGANIQGQHIGSGFQLSSFEPSISEEDFHATAASYQTSYQATSPLLDFGRSGGVTLHSPALEQTRTQPPTPRLTLDDISARISFQRQRNQTDNSRTRTQSDLRTQMHTRSTTLPPHPLGSDRTGAPVSLESRTRANVGIKAQVRYEVKDPPKSPSSSGERGPAVGPQLNNETNGIGLRHQTDIRHMESRGINASIHSYVRHNANPVRPVDVESRSDSLGMIETPTHTPIAPNTHTPSMQNTEAPEPLNTLSSPMADSSHSLDPRSSDNHSPPLHSPALTNETHTPATLSPSTPFSTFSTFSEPFSVVSPAVPASNGQVEVGLGMGVKVDPTTSLVVGDELKKVVHTAVQLALPQAPQHME